MFAFLHLSHCWILSSAETRTQSPLLRVESSRGQPREPPWQQYINEQKGIKTLTLHHFKRLNTDYVQIGLSLQMLTHYLRVNDGTQDSKQDRSASSARGLLSPAAVKYPLQTLAPPSACSNWASTFPITSPSPINNFHPFNFPHISSYSSVLC